MAKKNKVTKSAGLLLKYKNKILLVHPIGANWYGSFGLPKGKIEKGEEKIECAIRETFEETGLQVDRNDVDEREYTIRYKDKNGKTYKKVYYYIVEMDKVDELILPKDQLQTTEIDWAEFFEFEDAQYRIFWRQEDILRHFDNTYQEII